MKRFMWMAVLFFSAYHTAAQNIITTKKESGSFPVVSGNAAAKICTDTTDDWLVQKTALLLQQDIEKVTGIKPQIIHTLSADEKNIILLGNINKSGILQQLIQNKKLNATRLQNRWEGFQVQVINAPLKGVGKALVIAGTDRRGTAYGALHLSQQMGVSPWYWWADVPVKKQTALYIKSSAFISEAPSVKYRGIFINDEAPAFSGWAREKFGGINHLAYEHVFELLLRLKANYLWPAMWGNAFNDDDTLNPVLADQWGIVMGTSHHEPMLRAQQEWKRYGKGEWNYQTNDSALRSFWRKGIQNMGRHESIVTIGMRGDGDMPMTQGTATQLLERIVADQRKIITEETGQPAAQTPQLWALYKEVQDYYDKGMRVPDDVTLLLCDDNWGNIRKLPKLTDKPRSGGYGIYYHFDYVGGPRNYKWLNTNNLARVWEQMHLAYAYGVDKVWIVNVGDLKPMELPISFFLDYAWDTKKWNEDNIRDYYTVWAGRQFGEAYAAAIGNILRSYAKYSSRRKPEMIDAGTFSLTNYSEARTVQQQWEALLAQAEKISKELPAGYHDAYYELVLHPVKALTNLTQLYVAAGLNSFYAAAQSPAANRYADTVKELYAKDSLISMEYHAVANGKWNHMMDQTHIGYTYWQQPEVNKMPEVTYISSPKSIASVEGLYSISPARHQVAPESKIRKNLFQETGGIISIEAEHYTRLVNTKSITWKVIPDIGRTGSGITTFPVTATAPSPGATSPQLQYDIWVKDTGTVKLQCYFSPTLDFHNDGGLSYAVSVDNEPPQLININREDNNTKIWEGWAGNNIIIKTSAHFISKPGRHTVKYWMVSPGVILQKLVLDFGGLKPSYLGPPETPAR